MSSLFNPDFQEFIALLNHHEVEYVVCGGFAVNIYGHHRSTGDVDIWVNKTAANYRKLMKVFLAFGLPAFDMTMDNFLSLQYDVFSFGRPPSGIDILTALKGLAFDEVFANSTVYTENDIAIRVIHKNHLIEAKMAAGRPKDIDDIAHLTE
jgi:hypothetical protein